jgi:hypothetical protein
MQDRFVTEAELEEVRRVQVKYRLDWPATFSTNFHGEIWPFSRWGLTPGKDRELITGVCPLIDEVAIEFLQVRDGGGRFFVDRDGAYYKSDVDYVRFIRFQVVA